VVGDDRHRRASLAPVEEEISLDDEGGRAARSCGRNSLAISDEAINWQAPLSMVSSRRK
jgi:hypothetical protein